MRIDRVRHLAVMFVLAAMLASLAGGCAGPGPYQTSAPRLGTGSSALSDPTAVPTPCYRPLQAGADADADSDSDSDADAARAAPATRIAAPGACVRFVEFDDFGNLFNRAQIDETLGAARSVAARGGVVVVYVHGWEHNAASADPDVLKFYEAMRDARTIDGQYGGKRDVLGIYVGWRGQSLTVPLLSKLTFWERKTTAQAVGDGAVFELLRQLADYREQNVKSRLVVIGHSFGAAIVYSALSHSLTAQIIQDPLVQVAGSTLNLEKRWDMVVLINPAFEAMQVRPQLELALTQSYPPNQLPHVILVTSMADWATGMAFPAGRYLRSTLNRYADAGSPRMYTHAVGHYLPFITHQLAVIDSCEQFRLTAKSITAPDKLSVVFDEKHFCFDDDEARIRHQGQAQARERPVLLTRCEEPDDCELVAPRHVMKAPPGMPIVNIRTTREVMSGHNDIWNPTMRAFLVQLMIKIVERGEQPARTR